MDNRTIEEIRRSEDRLIDKNIELENINDKLSSALNSVEQRLDLYKSVIDEVEGIICAIYNSIDTVDIEIIKSKLKETIFILRNKVSIKESD